MANRAFFFQRFLQATSNDDYLVEDVDHSEAGWATDYAITILGFCFLWTTFMLPYPKSVRHFAYMHFGTAWAHLFGGFAHALYPNRASDGQGMVGFYVCMMLGYVRTRC